MHSFVILACFSRMDFLIISLATIFSLEMFLILESHEYLQIFSLLEVEIYVSRDTQGP